MNKARLFLLALHFYVPVVWTKPLGAFENFQGVCKANFPNYINNPNIKKWFDECSFDSTNINFDTCFISAPFLCQAVLNVTLESCKQNKSEILQFLSGLDKVPVGAHVCPFDTHGINSTLYSKVHLEPIAPCLSQDKYCDVSCKNMQDEVLPLCYSWSEIRKILQQMQMNTDNLTLPIKDRLELPPKELETSSKSVKVAKDKKKSEGNVQLVTAEVDAKSTQKPKKLLKNEQSLPADKPEIQGSKLKPTVDDANSQLGVESEHKKSENTKADIELSNHNNDNSVDNKKIDTSKGGKNVNNNSNNNYNDNINNNNGKLTKTTINQESNNEGIREKGKTEDNKNPEIGDTVEQPAIKVAEDVNKGNVKDKNIKVEKDFEPDALQETNEEDVEDNLGSLPTQVGGQVYPVSDDIGNINFQNPKSDLADDDIREQDEDADDGLPKDQGNNIIINNNNNNNNNKDGKFKAPEAEQSSQSLIETPPVGPHFTEAEDSHFFIYFLTSASIFILGYVAFHNKNKILAYALEGRRSRPTRRRPNSASYKKLDCNLEEAITSNTSHTVTNVVY